MLKFVGKCRIVRHLPLFKFMEKTYIVNIEVRRGTE